MGIRLYIYDKSPYDDTQIEILSGGAFGWGITNEIDKLNCEIDNKRKDSCNNDSCFMCSCFEDDFIKLTYKDLLSIDKETISHSTNIINSFCLNHDNCNLEKKCDLDCLVNNHRDFVWLNFN